MSLARSSSETHGDPGAGNQRPSLKADQASVRFYKLLSSGYRYTISSRAKQAAKRLAHAQQRGSIQQLATVSGRYHSAPNPA